MKLARLLIVGICLVIAVSGLPAQISATTDDGREVQLYRDGTWVAIDREAPVYGEGFRDIPWGSSEAVVRERYGEPLFTGVSIAYPIKVLEKDGVARFVFMNDELAYGWYRFGSEYSSADDYEDLKEALTRLYGRSDQSIEMADGNLFGRSAAQLELEQSWTLDETEIVLFLDLKDPEARLLLHYYGRDYQERLFMEQAEGL